MVCGSAKNVRWVLQTKLTVTSKRVHQIPQNIKKATRQFCLTTNIPSYIMYATSPAVNPEWRCFTSYPIPYPKPSPFQIICRSHVSHHIGNANQRPANYNSKDSSPSFSKAWDVFYVVLLHQYDFVVSTPSALLLLHMYAIDRPRERIGVGRMIASLYCFGPRSFPLDMWDAYIASHRIASLRALPNRGVVLQCRTSLMPLLLLLSYL